MGLTPVGSQIFTQVTEDENGVEVEGNSTSLSLDNVEFKTKSGGNTTDRLLKASVAWDNSYALDVPQVPGEIDVAIAVTLQFAPSASTKQRAQCDDDDRLIFALYKKINIIARLFDTISLSLSLSCPAFDIRDARSVYPSPSCTPTDKSPGDKSAGALVETTPGFVLASLALTVVVLAQKV